ncbi:MAG: hypothetical protein KJN73_09000 [Acidimicrobiia bacterium]|nr:hypothetical protein [Acidimicrobiia bacterium]
MSDLATRRQYLRPLYIGVILAGVGELGIFLVWGVWLFPEGDLLSKFAWIATCSLGMGLTVGGLVDLTVVERLRGRAAMGATIGLTALVIGVGCNYLCWSLDHQYNWWGGATAPGLFLGAGLVGSLILGWLYAYFLFSRQGPKMLGRVGI